MRAVRKAVRGRGTHHPRISCCPAGLQLASERTGKECDHILDKVGLPRIVQPGDNKCNLQSEAV